MTAHEIRLATSADREAATAVLSSAFSTDPMLTWLLRPSKNPEGRLQPFFNQIVGAEFRKSAHCVDVIGTEAVAVWHEVDDWSTPALDVIRMAPAIIRSFGTRVPRGLGVLTAMENAHPRVPHRYLSYLGVHKDHQGKGMGGALLESMAERLDEEGIPAYLENSNPLNTPLYARYGFEPRDLVPLSKGAPPLLAMWRNPR